MTTDALSNRDSNSTEETFNSQDTLSRGNRIRPEDEYVPLPEAVESLREVRVAIETGNLEAEELLDLSAEALDDAALSIKSVAVRNEVPSEEIFDRVRKLASEVLDARRPLLASVHNSNEGLKSVADSNKNKLTLSQSLSFRSLKKIDTPLIVWASETGTSKDLATSLSACLRSRSGGNVECVNMKDITICNVAQYKRVYIVCSTFGSGRPPRDGETFFSSLKRSQRKDGGIWEGVEFAVASLGNSTFEFFAVFGQMLSHELKIRGAEEIVPVSFIDGRGGKKKQKKHFVAWEKAVLSEFQEKECPDMEEDGKNQKSYIISAGTEKKTKDRRLRRRFSCNLEHCHRKLLLTVVKKL